VLNNKFKALQMSFLKKRNLDKCFNSEKLSTASDWALMTQEVINWQRFIRLLISLWRQNLPLQKRLGWDLLQPQP